MTDGMSTTGSALKRARLGRDQGFTLVELLVVVLIIGVLAGIAIPTYLNQRKKAVDASLKSDLKNAAIAARMIVDEGPFEAYWNGRRADLGFPVGLNPVPGSNPMRASWGPGGAYDTRGMFAIQGFKTATGQDHWTGWKGNRVFVGGEPVAGAWTLCAYHPNASTAVDAAHAMGYDETQGGLVPTMDCSSGQWYSLVPWLG
jgi:prepilin-type N-terminal cleavage/methylation domain-containing protein